MGVRGAKTGRRRSTALGFWLTLRGILDLFLLLKSLKTTVKAICCWPCSTFLDTIDIDVMSIDMNVMLSKDFCELVLSSDCFCGFDAPRCAGCCSTFLARDFKPAKKKP